MIDARQYLRSFRTKESQIQLKLEQIQRLKDRLLSTSASMDKEQVSHTKNVSAMQDTMAMVLDIEEEISELRNRLTKRRREILIILDQMKPEYASVLSGRFIERKTTKELGNILYLSKRQIERRMKDALDAFQLILNDLIEHGDVPWPATKEN